MAEENGLEELDRPGTDQLSALRVKQSQLSNYN